MRGGIGSIVNKFPKVNKSRKRLNCMEKEPLISVLMTAYNREKYIAEAIESVLASTYNNFELIIVDDASTDRTVEIAREYEKKDARIRVCVNEKNLGQFPNRNKASEYAKGEFIYYADSDDTLLPDGLEKLIHAMNQFPESGFGMYNNQVKEVTLIESKEGVYNHFFKKPFLIIGPVGTILRRKFFEKIGKYPTVFGIPGDMYFDLKACCASSVILMPFQFINYRIHQDQELSNKYDYLYNNYKYLNAALTDLPLPLSTKEIQWLSKKNKRRFVVNILKYFIHTGNFRSALKAVRLAGFNFGDALIGIFH